MLTQQPGVTLCYASYFQYLHKAMKNDLTMYM